MAGDKSGGLVLKEPRKLIWNLKGLVPGFYNTLTMSRISSKVFWGAKPENYVDMDCARPTSLGNIPASPHPSDEYVNAESICAEPPRGGEEQEDRMSTRLYPCEC